MVPFRVLGRWCRQEVVAKTWEHPRPQWLPFNLHPWKVPRAFSFPTPTATSPDGHCALGGTLEETSFATLPLSTRTRLEWDGGGTTTGSHHGEGGQKCSWLETKTKEERSHLSPGRKAVTLCIYPKLTRVFSHMILKGFTLIISTHKKVKDPLQKTVLYGYWITILPDPLPPPPPSGLSAVLESNYDCQTERFCVFKKNNKLCRNVKKK